VASVDLADLALERGVVVCCGSGGVGKTTVAAAVAVEAARQGRVACVVTIDPAKRLADALGLAALTDVPTRVDGVGPGQLWAVMLDTKSTFDAVVRRYAADAPQADAILANRMYRNIAGALSGTQEYMAMEKLYELWSGSGGQRYDLVVVDTPPTRNALDFIDAPRRLTRFLDNRVFRLILMPTRAYLRAVSVATQAFLRTVTKVVGGEVVADALAFFDAFEGMEQGFRERAQAVLDLLKDPTTAFVLVASPRRDTVEEALYFAGRLAEGGIAVAALVVNRVHPAFGLELPPLSPAPEGSALAVLERNLAELDAVAAREAGHLLELVDRVAPAPVTGVPFLPEDVHDLNGLELVASHLFGRA
jgi:anion-transporting  ArsA/GET3 family ATPase